jgi:DNA polymerase elongation subunit (family B)
VDAVWITVAPETDLEELRAAVEKEAGCPLALEGVYKWIRYAPSKRDELSGVPNRYFGAFSDGELKIRGIACRRRDTPKLIKDMQARLLERLARAGGLAECRAASADLLDIVEESRLRLREGRVTAEDLAVTFCLSKTPDQYVARSIQTIAARQLAAAGIKLHPGETVRYVITAAKDRVEDWRAKPLALMDGPLEYDAAKYLELVERAAAEVLGGLIAAPPPQRKKAAARAEAELPLVWS